MKESQYILVGDLTRLMNATAILRDITPETSGIIDQKKFNFVMRQLIKWRDDHFEAISKEDKDDKTNG